MPNTKSAIRRVRRVKKQTLTNRIKKSKYKKAIKIDISKINWVNNLYSIDLIKNIKLKARIRYRQPLQDIIIHIYGKKLYVEFKKYQTAITSGQFLALYHKNQLIASSVIP